jgi:hypothetical protein
VPTYGVPIPPALPGAFDSSLGNVLGQVGGTQAQKSAQTGGVLGDSIYVPQSYGPTVADNLAAQQKAQNDAAVNSAIGRLGLQSQIGNQNILGSYQSAYDQLTGKKAADLQSIQNQQQQQQQQLLSGRDQVGAGVRLSNQNLQRLLGAHGAGNSSAAQILAPYAAARQGAVQNAGLQDAYATNMDNLDTTLANTNRDYQNSFGQLLSQRQQKEQDLQSGIESNRAQLLSQRSDAANNQGQINSILDAVSRLGLNVNFTPQAPVVKAPDLAKYQVQQAAAPTVGTSPVDPGTAASVGPFLSLLTGQKKQQQLAGA